MRFITGQWQQRVGFEWALGYSVERRRLIDGTWRHYDNASWNRSAGTTWNSKNDESGRLYNRMFWEMASRYDDEFNPLNHGFDEYFESFLACGLLPTQLF